MILCVGTTPVMQRTMVFPRLQIDAVNRATQVIETASGKSINVARVLHTLGEETIATGFLGGDTGKFISADLAACGLANNFIQVPPKTRMCITVMDQSTREATELVEEARQVESQSWEKLRDHISARLTDAELMVLSGSLPPGGPVDFYAWCTERAHATGVGVIVDAAGEPLKLALAAKPLLVKPNRFELGKTLNVSIESDSSLRDAIKRLIAGGPTWAVITEGKSGAILSDGKEFWRLRPPIVKAINPIGSGDSLAAGLAAGIARGMPMIEACKLGIACGAANAETLTAGVVDRDRVQTLTDAVVVEKW